MEQRPKKLLDQVRDTIRTKHYSIRTERAYVDWIRRYILSKGEEWVQCTTKTLSCQEHF